MEPNVPSAGRKSQAGKWLVVAIVILILVAVGFAGVYLKKSDSGPRETIREIAPGETLTTAADGMLVTGFPAELIIQEGAVVSESYRIDYTNGNVRQAASTYLLGRSFQNSILAFRTYATEKGWALIEPGNSSENPTTIFAVKGVNQLNVILKSVAPEETQATVVLVEKQ